MYEVMTIRRQTEEELVCGTRLHERLAGVPLALVVSLLVLIVLEISDRGVSRQPWLLLLACVLSLPGPYIALSRRRFTFRRDSGTCVVRIIKFGIFRWSRPITFREVAIRRQFDWCLFRWLHLLVLADPSHAGGRAFPMAYVRGRSHAGALARKIADLTNTVAVGTDGQPVASRNALQGRRAAS